MRIYEIEHPTDILSQLASRGLDPADIDIVINTHLHFDHCGGNTLVRADEVIPTFPEAIYMVRRQEFEEASHPDERTAATYLHHNWLPVQAEGRLETGGGGTPRSYRESRSLQLRDTLWAINQSESSRTDGFSSASVISARLRPTSRCPGSWPSTCAR